MALNSKGYEENLYTKGCMRTNSGIYVNILNPTPDMFCIEDIAHALSMIPRFGGHMPVWYSVADHSINCMGEAKLQGMSDEDSYACLMHDASEAYISDIISPVKREITQYYVIEDKIMRILSKKFKFQYPLSENVKKIDCYMLEWEWQVMIGEFNLSRMSRSPQISKSIFLNSFKSFNQNDKTNRTH